MPVVSPFHPFSQQSSKSGQRGPPPSIASPLGGFSKSVRIDGLNSDPKDGGRGPAFVGQVFSMCNPSGTGLMAVTNHFDVPCLSKRIPEWIKRMVAAVTKHESTGPVFRFFMDLSDAVSYVKHLNIPTGMVGACRLDVAYGHFKDNPHMFHFVPNAGQVIEANKLLKANGRRNGKRKIQGVPVFTAENLNIAIETNDRIKWYTPYFFDKKLLDNILETSADQHFRRLIRARHMQRRQDVTDDADIADGSADSMIEPPEVEEAIDELSPADIPFKDIPLPVIYKSFEIEALDIVDEVLLGNRWLRKVTGIQPKFPYMVDSFEVRCAASLLKAKESTSSLTDTDREESSLSDSLHRVSGDAFTDDSQKAQGLPQRQQGFQIPFRDWIRNPLLKPPTSKDVNKPATALTRESAKHVSSNHLLPIITMVVAMNESGKASKAGLKKTMEDLTKELEQSYPRYSQNEDIDPLFIANVGDYSTLTRMNPF